MASVPGESHGSSSGLDLDRARARDENNVKIFKDAMKKVLDNLRQSSHSNLPDKVMNGARWCPRRRSATAAAKYHLHILALLWQH